MARKMPLNFRKEVSLNVKRCRSKAQRRDEAAGAMSRRVARKGGGIRRQGDRGKKKQGDVRFSEFSDCELFRRMEFPAPIDVETVTAKVEKGVLGVMARKAAVKKETERKISLAAA